MELASHKNAYGHEVIDCPFCTDWVYKRDNPEPARDLYRHITGEAKKEALAIELGESMERKHLDFYKEHTQSTPPKVVPKRTFKPRTFTVNK